jgi:glutamyl-tRNA reductase
MSLVIVGLSHRTAPIDLREHLAIAPPQMGGALDRLVKVAGAREAVLLSTCNRTEVYVRADAGSPGDQPLRAFFADLYKHPGLVPALYHHEGAAAVHHLFRVAAGLDSMVIGETEILGQVKSAYQLAQTHGATGKITNVLFQRALFVGKQVRTRTHISAGASSVGSVAVTLAERIFGSLHKRHVLLLGAGEMAEVTARHLLSQKTGQIVILNRTVEKAQALASMLNGRAGSIDALTEELPQADVVICSTSAEAPIVTAELVQKVMKTRRGKSLYFVDIAVPRNVEPAAHNLDNVYLYNIDDLQRIVDENMTRRRAEIDDAESFVAGLSREFHAWVTAALEGRTAALKHGHDHAAEENIGEG